MKPESGTTPTSGGSSSNRRAIRILLIAGVSLLILEVPLLLNHSRHGYFGIDGWFAFYAALGFVAALLLIFASRGIGGLVRRRENHYGEPADETLPDDLDERLR